MMIDTPDARLNRTIQSLEGLSVGEGCFILGEIILKHRLDFHNPNLRMFRVTWGMIG
jgi:hypothetical protein